MKKCITQTLRFGKELGRILWHGLSAGSTEEFYDRFSPYYERFFSAQGTYAEQASDILKAYLSKTGRQLDAVLDCGCGTRVYSAELGELCDELHGLDFSAGQLSGARGKGLEMSLTRGDVTKLPYTSGRFDLVASLGMMRHLPGDMLSQYAEEAYRVLRPGGILFTEPVPLNMVKIIRSPAVGKILSKTYNAFMRWRGLDEHIGPRDATEKALSAAGFIPGMIEVTDSETGEPLYEVFVGRKPFLNLLA